MTARPHTPAARRPWRPVLGLAVAVLAVGAWTARADASPHAVSVPHEAIPVNAAFEGRSGIRVDRIAVVGDGGLIDVRYTVLDAQKAHGFVGDSDHTAQGESKVGPPVLRSRTRRIVVSQAATMHAHTEFSGGQTFSLLYLNPGGEIRPGDVLDLVGGPTALAFPGIRVE